MEKIVSPKHAEAVTYNQGGTMKEDLKVCQQCGYTWVSRVEDPVQCPRCKRYDWDKKEAK